MNISLPALDRKIDIVSAGCFDLSLVKPPKLWPFKQKYHLTMGTVEPRYNNAISINHFTYRYREFRSS